MALRLVSGGGDGSGKGGGGGDAGDGGGNGGGREGRGRLSTINMLPEVCDPDVTWLNGALVARKLPQTDILREFNERIAAKGQDPISKGAFSRYSVAKAANDRKLDASRAAYEIALRRFDGLVDRSDNTLKAIEIVKAMMVEAMTADDMPSLKDLNNVALMINRLSRTAIMEAEHKRREERNQREEDREAAERDRAELEELARNQANADADSITRIAQEAGLSGERIAAIRRGVLGLAA